MRPRLGSSHHQRICLFAQTRSRSQPACAIAPRNGPQKEATKTREYFFELFEARAAIYGARTLDEFLTYGPKMSPIDLHQRSASRVV
jgi:hypothetical protein